MQLTKEEEKSLDGENGEALATAYRILLAIGEANEAKNLVPIRWAHVSGVNYNTIGEAGEKFLKNISKEGTKVSVFTTINPAGFDLQKQNNLSDEFNKGQYSIINSYRSLGVTQSFSCTPYEIFDIPESGTRISFAESNAAVFMNSIMNLQTNKESALSSLASAITGKTPYSDLLIDKNREARISIVPDVDIDNELDFGLLGYFAGKTSDESCIGIELKDERKINDIMNAKAISAAIGTSGVCGMFKNTKSIEKISFGKEEFIQVKDELDTTENGDIIVLGSPQLGVNEMKLLADSLKDRRFSKKCFIFCSRNTHNKTKELGLNDKIEKSNCEIFCDSCTCLTPLINKTKYDSIITNSIKCAYYMKHVNKIDVSLKDLKTIIKENAR